MQLSSKHPETIPCYIDGMRLGEIRQLDNEYQFWPDCRVGFWPTRHLRKIAETVDRLNEVPKTCSTLCHPEEPCILTENGECNTLAPDTELPGMGENADFL